jgi:putative DNA primase/helicase
VVHDDDNDPLKTIAEAVESAEAIDLGEDYDDTGYDDDDYDPPEPPFGGECVGEPSDPVDRGVLAACARLDHSDTDNGIRLREYYGQDLSVIAQDEVTVGTWLAWADTHWDVAGGAARARMTVQKLGGRILQEADFLTATPFEARAVEEGGAAEGELEALEARRAEWNDAERARARRLEQVVAAGKVARAALDKRKVARRKFAISSKNKARMEAALECAGPKLRRPPDSFNPDRYKVATLTHTLTFWRELDPECPDPDAARYVWQCEAVEGHAREDWITAVVPVAYVKDAPAPRWRGFLERMLPDAQKRRTVQQFAGLGLLGVPAQYLMFHYGLGANGKSVFLETTSRLLGPGLAVGLPRESIVGASERNAGAASPDLVRLYGKRMVRILEVKGDAPLQEDLIKRLTGGESLPVRTLFKGYFEFQNVATAHMSGNGFPSIDGTDNGIWRRLLVVQWDQVIPEEERRDFEEVVTEFIREEGEGILAWLIEGVLDYLQHGLVIAPSVRNDTDDYREEMDPVGEFTKTCVREAVGQRVQAHTMYEAYVSWSMANAKRARSQTKFGKTLAQRFRRAEISGRNYYLDCELHDVPDRPDAPRNPYE